MGWVGPECVVASGSFMKDVFLVSVLAGDRIGRPGILLGAQRLIQEWIGFVLGEVGLGR